MAIPCTHVATDAIKTPIINTGRRPNLTINKDAGKVVSIDITNCRERPSVASQAKGDSKLPTSAVLIIFTFMVVIDNACATANRVTLPIFEGCFCIFFYLNTFGDPTHNPVCKSSPKIDIVYAVKSQSPTTLQTAFFEQYPKCYKLSFRPNNSSLWSTSSYPISRAIFSFKASSSS